MQNNEGRKLKICHLYPDLLNLYGDRGNILSLVRRSELRGIEVEVTPITIDDWLDINAYDLFFLGGGQDAEQNLLREDFVKVKGSKILEAVRKNKVFLCICGGFQLMGKYYDNKEGHRIECLGAIDVWTIGQEQRFIGNTVSTCQIDIIPTGIGEEFKKKSKILLGFENHSGRTYLGKEARPLGKIVKGFGNNGEDKTEGAIYKNVYCTYSHGSFLPKNPAMTDYLIKTALNTQRGDIIELSCLDSRVEDVARESCLKLIQHA